MEGEPDLPKQLLAFGTPKQQTTYAQVHTDISITNKQTRAHIHQHYK